MWIILLLWIGCTARTPFAWGYALLPAPQRANIGGPEFQIGSAWRVEAEGEASEVARIFQEESEERNNLRFVGKPGDGPAIRLVIRPGAVSIGSAQDRDQQAVASQAYQIALAKSGIQITANGEQGLFYGVQTLLQLMCNRDGASWLPTGRITDWPDLQLREIYWDDAHHLERLDVLKQAIRQAAFFKINGFVIKLDGHFQYRSAPAVVEPQALSPDDLQTLTDFGLRYHVQLIAYLDGPGHCAFILKHPEYAALRAFADCNYEFDVSNPKTYELLSGMCRDLLDANKGSDYFYLSTDEPYYVGTADSERALARQLGSPGKLLARFIAKTAGYLREQGRKVIFWGEHPLAPEDVPALPNDLINGETIDRAFDTAFRNRGIRQMFYVSTEGEEKLFPNYFILPAALRPRGRDLPKPRIEEAFATVQSPETRAHADLMGMLVAGWADMGLHPETFWLGYSTIAAAGWNPNGYDAPVSTSNFFAQFYGPSAQQMNRVYELMSRQAQFWADSWESAPTTARKGIWGYSAGIFRPRHPAEDQTIDLPPAPSGPELSFDSHWSREKAKLLQCVAAEQAENDELIDRLNQNLNRVEFNRYNLEVFRSIAELCRQSLHMLRDISKMDAALTTEHQAAAANQPVKALAALDEAIDFARKIRAERNQVLKDATATWYKSWLPRVAEGNGRISLHELDDVKDHLPDRTVGMEYLVYRELILRFGNWVGEIQSARNVYAKAHHLELREEPVDWEKVD